MSFTQHTDPFLYSDEFGQLPTAEFPVKNHFHVSKADRDRDFIEVLGQRTRAYMMIAAVAIISITAVLGAGAFVALDRAEAARRV